MEFNISLGLQKQKKKRKVLDNYYSKWKKNKPIFHILKILILYEELKRWIYQNKIRMNTWKNSQVQHKAGLILSLMCEV